jgi:hypothetical protein
VTREGGTVNRREFLVRAGVLAAAPIVLQITACGDDSGGGPAANTDRFTFQGTDSGHSHTAEITCAQLRGGADLTLSNRADGIHAPHTDIVITASQLTTILGGGTVMVNTTSQGHPHTWSISRPAGAC